MYWIWRQREEDGPLADENDWGQILRLCVACTAFEPRDTGGRDPADVELLPHSMKIIVKTSTAGECGENITREGAKAIFEAVDTLKRYNPDNDATFYWVHFLEWCKSRGAGFIKIYGETWAQDLRARTKFTEQSMPAAIKRLLKILRTRTGGQKWFGRVWPYPVSSTDATVTYVVNVQVRINRDPDLKAELLQESMDELKACLQEFATDETKPNSILQADLVDYFDVLTMDPPLAPGLPKFVPPANAADEHSPAVTSLVDAAFADSRFRTALDAMSRLRHDPSHAGIEYEVGYEDRHEGLMWKALEAWVGRRQTEEEEWIPTHRIRKIRRKKHGIVVWDKETRMDET